MTEKTIVKGSVTGKVIKSNQPINFLSTIDKKTGFITDQKHNLAGKSIKDSILLFPHGVGSSVGAYTIYSLKSTLLLGSREKISPTLKHLSSI